jgi:transcriptional repressor NrdR
MRCPYCAAPDTQVKDSRGTDDGAAIRRRRSCTVCGGRFTTFERVQLRELVVVKRSGKREPFDRDKLARSVAIATRKRDVPEDVLDRMITGIVRQLEQSGESEVPAARIGEAVMEALRSMVVVG